MRAYKSSDLDKDSYVNKREFPVLLRYLGSEVSEFIGVGGYVGFWKGKFHKTLCSKCKISKKNYDFSSQECHLLQQGLDRWELGKPPKPHKKPAKSMTGIEVFDSMDVDSDRRLAFPEFRQGLSLLGMTSAGETQSQRYKRQEVMREYYYILEY